MHVVALRAVVFHLQAVIALLLAKKGFDAALKQALSDASAIEQAKGKHWQHER